MRLPNASKTILTGAAILIATGVVGIGSWVYAQNVPPAEIQGMKNSRIGQTQRGQAPMPLPETPTVEPSAVPPAEVQGMKSSRIGQTQRGQAPMPLPETPTVEPSAVPPAEVQGMKGSRIGQTQRGQAPMPMENK